MPVSSTFSTSAPRSASSSEQKPPGSRRVRSRTLTSRSGVMRLVSGRIEVARASRLATELVRGYAAQSSDCISRPSATFAQRPTAYRLSGPPRAHHKPRPHAPPALSDLPQAHCNPPQPYRQPERLGKEEPLPICGNVAKRRYAICLLPAIGGHPLLEQRPQGERPNSRRRATAPPHPGRYAADRSRFGTPSSSRASATGAAADVLGHLAGLRDQLAVRLRHLAVGQVEVVLDAGADVAAQDESRAEQFPLVA